MGVPNLPGRRRATPKAFARPSVDLDHHGRSWVDSWPVGRLKSNDIVAGKGSVVEVSERSVGVSVVFPSGTVFYQGHERVKAFVVPS